MVAAPPADYGQRSYREEGHFPWRGEIPLACAQGKLVLENEAVCVFQTSVPEVDLINFS